METRPEGAAASSGRILQPASWRICSSIFYRRLDFAPVAHDPFIFQQRLNLRATEAADRLDIKTAEGPPVMIPFFQDGQPAQAGLGAFEEQHFKKASVVVPGNTPFVIMVGAVQRVVAAPAAAREILVHGVAGDVP
jgi:hypothetical protein